MLKSPHILVSLFSLILMVGLARAVPSIEGPRLADTARQEIVRQPQLGAKIQTLLPRGSDLERAAIGFQSLGEFISAVHIADNLDIPFPQLKARVTGPSGVSFHQAIREFRPSANPTAEVKRALEQARKDQERNPG